MFAFLLLHAFQVYCIFSKVVKVWEGVTDGAVGLPFLKFEGFKVFRVIDKEIVYITRCVDVIHWSIVVYMFVI